MRKMLSVQILFLFLLSMFLTRIGLCFYAISIDQIPMNFNFIKVFAVGTIYDCCTIIYIMPVVVGIIWFLPTKYAKNSSIKFFFITLVVFFLFFNAVAEVLFWDEFGTRFNFIAVDYLIYMDEVAKNIWESYPIFKIMALITALSILVARYLWKRLEFSFFHLKHELLLVILLAFISNYCISATRIELANKYENELAHNGIYNLFSAFVNNSLSYNDFYRTIDENKAFRLVQKEIGITETGEASIKRFIDNGTPKGYNVILVVVESLSAEYLAKFGNNEKLTPYLDELTNYSISFNKYYASGTRTVRGLEAITLSVPPTPGTSIVRMPNNEHLFSLGTVLNQYDYIAKFLYGGYGYFDNMSHFFGENNFEVIDRSSFQDDEISFANAWGVADGDLYKKAINEADKDFSSKRPFFYFIMTTSNHRPFTYPDGAIKTPSGQGRKGAVEYTDYAIANFIKSAKSKQWFNNTIFVITADHCAGSSGKNDLPLNNYHIPLIIYAPKILSPREVNHLTGQIDLAPTLLSIMGLSYESRFYGVNALEEAAKRIFISTFQKMGYYKNDSLVVLAPKQEVKQYEIKGNNQMSVEVNEFNAEEAISFYQSSYFFLKNGLMKE